MLVWGDSHVRRLSEFRHRVESRLNNVVITFIGIGGATTSTLMNRIETARGYDIVCLMVGGNDVSNGISANSLVQSYEELATTLWNLGIRTVVFASMWPRADRSFNRMIGRVSQIMENRYMGHRRIVFWKWDRRQPMRTYDGVHLTVHGYKKACVYLVSLLVWVLHHR